MSVTFESWAWQQPVGNPTRKQVFARLANAADEDGWSWYGQKRIASECELSRSAVNEHIAALRGMGLVQVVTRKRPDGKRATNFYRVLAPWINTDVPPPNPWKHRSHVAQDDTGHVAQDDSMNSQLEPELEVQDPAALRAAPVPLGQRRWRVSSNTTPGKTYSVDLARGSCTCEARVKVCAHQRAALKAEEEAETARRRELRDALWDALVEIYGVPPPRRESDRGLIVSDLAAMLTADKIEATPERWAEEVKDRYEALSKDWGVGKTTLRAFAQNWPVAGKLVAKSRGNGHNGDDEFDIYTRA